jgi:tetratricopeptide (TPR) repeat protein
VAKTTTVLVSLTDNDVPKNARKEYESGLDDAAKSKWKDAIAAMKKGTSEYPKFATAWLSLGILQSSQNDAAAALRSFAQAIAADDKFALPYIESAALESAASQWSTVVEHTAKAISLDPDSFAVVYYLNAMANVRLGEADAARKSVTEGLRVDQDHAYPDLEYIDGMLRMSNNDPEGARTQFQSYLARTPDGPNADNARQLLTKLQTAK